MADEGGGSPPHNGGGSPPHNGGDSSPDSSTDSFAALLEQQLASDSPPKHQPPSPPPPPPPSQSMEASLPEDKNEVGDAPPPPPKPSQSMEDFAQILEASLPQDKSEGVNQPPPSQSMEDFARYLEASLPEDKNEGGDAPPPLPRPCIGSLIREGRYSEVEERYDGAQKWIKPAQESLAEKAFRARIREPVEEMPKKGGKRKMTEEEKLARKLEKKEEAKEAAWKLGMWKTEHKHQFGDYGFRKPGDDDSDGGEGGGIAS